jgi:TatA/E family protein of Tat protein translocase
MFGNLGFTEILVLGAIVLLIFGPRRLPELAKGLGKGIREFKKALTQSDDSEDSHEPLKDTTREQLPKPKDTDSQNKRD